MKIRHCCNHRWKTHATFIAPDARIRNSSALAILGRVCPPESRNEHPNVANVAALSDPTKKLCHVCQMQEARSGELTKDLLLRVHRHDLGL